MMSDDTVGYGFFLGVMFTTVIGIGIATSLANSAEEVVKQQTIKYCVETPQKCKLEYDYLKLKETQTN